MTTTLIIVSTACIFAIAYRFYGIWIANKVLKLNAKTVMPSHAETGDFTPTNKWVLLGSHFAAIAGGGPILGPVLAAQFGFAPGFLWILMGCVLGGAVHDMICLWGGTRFNGGSLAVITGHFFGKGAKTIMSFLMLCILLLVLSAFSAAIMNALSHSPWATFSIGVTIPIALCIGVYMRKTNNIVGGTILGLILLTVGVWAGSYVPGSMLEPWFTLNHNQLAIAIALYGLCASALPMWLLLVPRDYMSSFLKVGVMLALTVGVLIQAPSLKMPAFSPYVWGSGPVIPGGVFPFLFLTIACGALSGFHSLIAMNNTAKLVTNEKDILVVGYGAMLLEGFIAVIALITACCMEPSDYYAINATAEAYARTGLVPTNLPALSQLVQEQLIARTGGAVSLAVGMTQIFISIPWFKTLAAFFYHFCLLFEAVFIMSALDNGIRVGKYLIMEQLPTVFSREISPRALNLFAATLFCAGFYWLIRTVHIATVWPLFGAINGLLAAGGLLICGKLIPGKYRLITIIPGCFIGVIALWGNILSMYTLYIPKGLWTLTAISGMIWILVLCFLISVVKGKRKIPVGDYHREPEA